MMKHKVISILMLAAMLTTLLAGCGGSNKASGTTEPESKKLVVYAALNESDMVEIQKKFKADTGIDIEYVRFGAGDAAAKIRAEKDAPVADVFIGGSVEMHDPLAKDGLLLQYSSPRDKEVDAKFIDKNGYWHGWYMGVLGYVINKDRFDKELRPKGLEYPRTWDDVLDPAYKGNYVHSNAATAGGAYIFLADQIFRLGEEKAWQYMERLNANVHHYTPGALTPIQLVASGEFIMGMSWGHDILAAKKQGYPIDLVVPADTAFEIGGLSIIKGGKNLENAKKFVDWTMSREVGEMNTKISNRYSTRADVAPPEGMPKISDVKLVNYDRDWALANRDQEVQKFSKMLGQ